MRPLELCVLYLLIGGAIGLAMARGRHSGALLAVPLWPLFLPGLLVRVSPPSTSFEASAAAPCADRIEEAVEGLRGALLAWEAAPAGLDVEAPLRAVRRGLGALDQRHAELSRALAQPRNDRDQIMRTWEAAPQPARDLLTVQLRSLDQLLALREGARLELERGLAAVGELAARVEIARFTGVAASDVAAQLSLLAAAVDGAAEVRRLAPPRPRDAPATAP
jgi:hypothetical protein